VAAVAELDGRSSWRWRWRRRWRKQITVLMRHVRAEQGTRSSHLLDVRPHVRSDGEAAVAAVVVRRRRLQRRGDHEHRARPTAATRRAAISDLGWAHRTKSTSHPLWCPPYCRLQLHRPHADAVYRWSGRVIDGGVQGGVQLSHAVVCSSSPAHLSLSHRCACAIHRSRALGVTACGDVHTQSCTPTDVTHTPPPPPPPPPPRTRPLTMIADVATSG